MLVAVGTITLNSYRSVGGYLEPRLQEATALYTTQPNVYHVTRQQRTAYLCELKGFGGSSRCWRTLLAMVAVESGGKAHAIGDGGSSIGYYQIRVKLHNVSEKCAKSFTCSTNWTLDYMIKNGAKSDWWTSVARHNGGGKQAQDYLSKVKSLANQL